MRNGRETRPALGGAETDQLALGLGSTDVDDIAPRTFALDPRKAAGVANASGDPAPPESGIGVIDVVPDLDEPSAEISDGGRPNAADDRREMVATAPVDGCR